MTKFDIDIEDLQLLSSAVQLGGETYELIMDLIRDIRGEGEKIPDEEIEAGRAETKEVLDDLQAAINRAKARRAARLTAAG